MLRVGLTGGIGAGKSTVAGRLADHGATLIDADKIAREVVAPGTPGLAEVVRAFGVEVLTADGDLNRAALAAKAFDDEKSRQLLNGILHPRIGARAAELMAEAASDAIVVHDIPLLVEESLAVAYHLVIVVDAAEEVRVRRLVESRGLDEADARARIAAQSTEQQRRAAADVWLNNNGTPDIVLSEVDGLWVERLVPFEANIRLRRLRQAMPAHIVDYNPSWPVHAQRLIGRVRAAAGNQALRVDHIGSTAVSGLPAKDIIDLQLTVSSLADADALAEPLADAGFPRFRNIDQDDPQPFFDPDPERWRKRVHVSADPGRAANLHIRVQGWPAQRLALLFRDWLRAEAEPRAEYLALKRQLAEAYSGDESVDDYVIAKQPWVNQGLLRAKEWARRSGWSPE